jgi:predicted MPP superfamily phosphohydrolase
VKVPRRLTRAASVAVASGVVWGSIEARALRQRVLEVRLAGLPPVLDGVTILHLSDVHAGHGPGLAMLERTVAWSAELRPDLVALTGDLVTRARGIARLQRACAALAATAGSGAFAVLGNHDHGDATDPFADGSSVDQLDGFALLPGAEARFELRGRSASIVGVDAAGFPKRRTLQEVTHADRSADLRVLLCHFPIVLDRLEPGAFQLVLAGHMHGGQICVPGLDGRIGLSHPRARYLDGLYQREGTLMHVSAGLGTTFLPLRVLARPEATLLVLRSPGTPASGR